MYIVQFFFNKFNRFILRSLEKVKLEFLLMAIGHNLRKWAGKIAQIVSNTMSDPSPPLNLGSFLGLYFQNLINRRLKSKISISTPPPKINCIKKTFLSGQPLLYFQIIPKYRTSFICCPRIVATLFESPLFNTTE